MELLSSWTLSLRRPRARWTPQEQPSPEVGGALSRHSLYVNVTYSSDDVFRAHTSHGGFASFLIGANLQEGRRELSPARSNETTGRRAPCPAAPGEGGSGHRDRGAVTAPGLTLTAPKDALTAAGQRGGSARLSEAAHSLLTKPNSRPRSGSVASLTPRRAPVGP